MRPRSMCLFLSFRGIPSLAYGYSLDLGVPAPVEVERMWRDLECPTSVVMDWLEEHAHQIPGATEADVMRLVARYRGYRADGVPVVE